MKAHFSEVDVDVNIGWFFGAIGFVVLVFAALDGFKFLLGGLL